MARDEYDHLRDDADAADLAEGRHRLTTAEDPSGVINEIGDEIDSGNAHLMTRNELAEFMTWWLNHPSDLNANQMIYEAMDLHENHLVTEDVQKIAKEFFIYKDYEREA